ncbi:RteC domain-containing protein [Alistipes timonensis]|uniref:RteC domain-containing protein n=1 Tax=Alistipes timonensis TaxID=1465754 RepID=UPI00214AA796|nr:RteC domain-containing protein [Alistipes timonensis]MCR2031608.1 RteC domain-containing protein [Alistipes timonensis]
MVTFIEHLKSEMDKKLQPILSADLNIMKKSHEASLVYAETFNQLKKFIAGYTFHDDVEEIHFFKEIKPRLCYGLIYWRKIYNIEINRPEGVESQRAYLIDEIRAINRYNSQRSDFVRYYRSGLTYLDSIYYLRGHSDAALYLESFYYERDPMFSTNCDFTVARLMANESLIEYLNKALDGLENHWLSQSLPRVRITWSAQKTDLYELIFACDSRKVFGNVPMTQLVEYLQTVFNIELDKNISRSFSDMRIRNTQTPFLDNLKESLIERMEKPSKKRDR